MNDYDRGALEALAWIQHLINRMEEEPGNWEKLRDEVAETKEALLRGIGIDFKKKIEGGGLI